MADAYLALSALRKTRAMARFEKEEVDIATQFITDNLQERCTH
jgi:hypothetical protein